MLVDFLDFFNYEGVEFFFILVCDEFVDVEVDVEFEIFDLLLKEVCDLMDFVVSLKGYEKFIRFLFEGVWV